MTTWSEFMIAVVTSSSCCHFLFLLYLICLLLFLEVSNQDVLVESLGHCQLNDNSVILSFFLSLFLSALLIH